MKKNLLIIILSIFVFSLLLSAFAPTLNSREITYNSFREITFENRSELENDRPRSVILFIGDGMGYEHMKLAQLVEYGETGILEMQTLPFNTSMTTLNINGEITDSAASGTAIATGYKTLNRYIGLDSDGQEIPNIAEIVKSELHKSIGIVSTAHVAHATPASFLAHVESRYYEDEIIAQIVEDQTVDVLFGGDFIKGGISQFDVYEDNLTINGYSVVRNKTEMDSLQSGKAVGLFVEYHYYYSFPTEENRNRTITPSLAEMTSKAIELLSQDPNGFFLMVEGAQIDWAGHDNDAPYVALETIEMDKAIAEAKLFADLDGSTMIITTSDHETGGLTVNSYNLNSLLPSTEYTDEENEQIRLDRVANISVSWTSEDHTAIMVPFYAYNYESSLEDYSELANIDNTNVFDIMIDYFYSDNSDPNVVFEELSNNILINQTAITLNFTVDRYIIALYYSINNGENISLLINSSNIELYSLEDGNYTINLFAEDFLGNIGQDSIIFTTKTIVEQSDTSSSDSETSSFSNSDTNVENQSTFSIDYLTAISALIIPLLFKKKSQKSE